MTLTATQYALWFAGFIIQAFLVVVMLKRGSYRRWPSLFTMAIFEMALFVILYATVTHYYAIYFYVYWGGSILRAFLGLWLVFDVIKALPGIQYAPKSLALGFVSLAVTLAAGSAWLASSGGTHTLHLTMMAFTLARCISVIWGTVAITLFAAIGFCGLGWTPTPLRMACSFLVFILISCAGSYAMSVWPSLSFKISDISNLCTIGIWLSWSGIMRKESSDTPQRVLVFPPYRTQREVSGL